MLVAVAMPAVVAALAAVATLSGLVAVFLLVESRRSGVAERLAGFTTDAAVPAASADAPRLRRGLKESVLEAVDQLAQRAGISERVRTVLDDADVSLRPAEALTIWWGSTVLGFFLGGVAGGGLVGLLGGAVGMAIPVRMVRRRRKARRQEFEAGLPDALSLLAGSLRSGFSLLQGLETIAEETTGALHDELQRACAEVRLGRAVEDALDEAGERMGSEDLQWAVIAIRIHRDVGGNLAELLDTVANTMVQRDRLRREVRALTAEGRLSAIVLSVFPPAAALLLFLLQPDYMGLLFRSTVGITAVAASCVLLVCGWWWLRKIVRIEV